MNGNELVYKIAKLRAALDHLERAHRDLYIRQGSGLKVPKRDYQQDPDHLLTQAETQILMVAFAINEVVKA